LLLTNGTAGSADYTTTNVIVTCSCNYWNGIGTNNCGYIDEVDETLALHGTASATGTIIDNNNAPTVATITPASATEGSDVVFDFTLSNPSAVDTSYTFVLTNGMVEVRITHY
jgi:hypothetical protein